MRWFSLLFVFAVFCCFLQAESLPPLPVVPQIILRDATILRNVKIISYGSTSVTARWEGGRGSIAHADLSPQLRKEVEARRPAGLAAPSPAPVSKEPVVIVIPEPKPEGGEYRGVVYVGASMPSAHHTPLVKSTIRAYPMEAFVRATQQGGGMPDPLASAESDEDGHWSMYVPRGIEFMLQAEGEHVAPLTGNKTRWIWRIPGTDMEEGVLVELTEKNAAIGSQRGRKVKATITTTPKTPAAMTPGRIGGGQR